ncbi:MAG: hypothetical protein EXS14_01750 [Planctomycetes bacterium]|nr:hypothetical protein [Planctomycetota bacterium]
MLLKRLPLLALLLIALGLRLSVICSPASAVVEIDGAEYCRMAENIAAGEGLRGMLPGSATMMPPLYPLCIAALMPLCSGDSVLAARIVACCASLASVALAWCLLRRVMGGAAAFAGGLALSIAPLFVLCGSSTFAEALQMAVLLGALLCAHATLQSRSSGTALLTGALFGLASLTRIESVVLAALCAAWMLLPHGTHSLKARLRSATLCGAGCVVLLAPWVVHLHEATGAWRLEAKSARVAATVERFALGLDYANANYGIDDAGAVQGPWLRPDLAWPAAERGLCSVWAAHPTEVLRYWGGNLKRTGWWFLSGHVLSSALVLIGAWYGWRALRRGTSGMAGLLALIVVTVICLGCLYKPVLRYSAPASLCLWLLAAVAAGHVASTTKRPTLFASVLVLLCALTTLRGVPEHMAEFGEGSNDVAYVAGVALRKNDMPHGPLLCSDARLPFACGRTWLPLPAAPSATALARHATDCGAAALLWRRDDPACAKRPGAFALDADLSLAGYSESAAPPQGWRMFVRSR